jgi:hypothetical protein
LVLKIQNLTSFHRETQIFQNHELLVKIKKVTEKCTLMSSKKKKERKEKKKKNILCCKTNINLEMFPQARKQLKVT